MRHLLAAAALTASIAPVLAQLDADAVDTSPHAVVDDPTARAHVQHREQQLKKSQSRFTNIARLRLWSGASGTRPLSFRWHQAKSHLQDLADAS